MKSAVVVVILVGWLGVAVADIIVWQDDDGVSHYTNLKGEVPKEQEDTTRVVVDEAARQPAATTVPVGAEEVTPRAPEPQAHTGVVSDPTEVTDAYVRGVLRGIESARSAAESAGGTAGDHGDTIVQINGPLAVVNTATPEPYYQPYYQSSYPWFYAPGFFPGVATPFLDGRARRLHRQLNANFLPFEQRVVSPAGRPPLGVALDPITLRERVVPPAGLPPLGVALDPLLVRPFGRTAGGGVSHETRLTR